MTELRAVGDGEVLRVALFSQVLDKDREDRETSTVGGENLGGFCFEQAD